jgi:small-conductance mechanosensitive channel
MPVLSARGCHYEVSIIIGQGNQIVYFIFFESEGFDYMLYFHTEQVNQEDLVVKSNHYLVLAYFNLLDF